MNLELREASFQSRRVIVMFTWILIVLGYCVDLPCISTFAIDAYAQDQEPVPPVADADLVGPISLHFVEPAKQPIPALRYRFHPNPRELNPGSATPYFQRAMIQYLKKPAVVLNQFKQFKLAYEEGVAKTAIADELQPFQDVFVELKKLGDCEDLRWDDRWRDLRGIDLWEAMFPEFQEARELSHLIEYNARKYLKQKDFTAAIAWIQLGYRFAEYLGNGDSIVQGFVASSRCQAMNYVVREAISTPGCPNLYWALATLPEPMVSMQRAIDIECLGIEFSFPILAKAESTDLGREQWQQLWKDTFSILKRMAIIDNQEDLSMNLEQAFQKNMEADMATVRKALLRNGYPVEQIASMCTEQLVALNALCEVRTRSSEFAKATFLPFPLRSRELTKGKLEYEKYLAQNPNSIFAIIQLQSTKTELISDVETRQVCHVRQLMTVEAIRMHVAEHASPPASLDDLHLSPALPNPFHGSPFLYSVAEEEDAWHIRLNCEPRPNGMRMWLPEQDFRIKKK